ALRAKQNDHIVTVDSSEEGADLYTTNDLLDESNLSQLFEVYDWGQEGKSLRSLVNNRWVTSPANADSAISNTDATLLNLTNNDWDGSLLEGDTSTIPPRLRLETNEDGTTSIITNGYLTGFGGNYPNWYNTRGRLVSVTEEGKLATSADVIQN